MALDALLSPKDHSFAMSCVQSYLRAPITVHLKRAGVASRLWELCVTHLSISSHGQFNGGQRMYRSLRSILCSMYSADTLMRITQHLRRGPQRQTPGGWLQWPGPLPHPWGPCPCHPWGSHPPRHPPAIREQQHFSIGLPNLGSRTGYDH